ncbi:hypothetical protein J6590_024239 [Homalodisca vitripennis]|nr:hypothetical protein J6590_024239 [Homalodisca vitripennis]
MFKRVRTRTHTHIHIHSGMLLVPYRAPPQVVDWEYLQLRMGPGKQLSRGGPKQAR